MNNQRLMCSPHFFANEDPGERKMHVTGEGSPSPCTDQPAFLLVSLHPWTSSTLPWGYLTLQMGQDDCHKPNPILITGNPDAHNFKDQPMAPVRSHRLAHCWLSCVYVLCYAASWFKKTETVSAPTLLHCSATNPHCRRLTTSLTQNSLLRSS